MFGELSVEAQDGVPGSTLELYRTALGLRAQWMTADEEFEWVDVGDHALAFRRGSGVVCVVNFGPEPLPLSRGLLPVGDVLVASEQFDGPLPPDTTVWIRRAALTTCGPPGRAGLRAQSMCLMRRPTSCAISRWASRWAID